MLTRTSGTAFLPCLLSLPRLPLSLTSLQAVQRLWVEIYKESPEERRTRQENDVYPEQDGCELSVPTGEEKLNVTRM